MHRISQQMGAVLLAGVYSLAGLLWIFYSDQYFAKHADDAYQLTLFQTYKGWGFVVVTTLLVYGLIRLSQFHHAKQLERSTRLERVQKVLGDVSQAIIKSRNIADLFITVCRIAAEEGGFPLVWIGRIDETRKAIKASAVAGAGAQLVEGFSLQVDPALADKCAMSANLLDSNPFLWKNAKEAVCDAPWCKIAHRQGYHSVLALPIKTYNALGGAIIFYSADATAFDGVEAQILETLAIDLGLALTHAEDEQRWILALEGAGHGVWDGNLVTKKIFFSHQWKALLGYADDDIGDDMTEWSSRIHPEDMSLCMEQIERINAGASDTFIAEYRLRGKNGAYRWIRAQGSVFSRDEDNKPLRIVGTDTDITEKKSRERAFSDAQRAARIGSYIYDARQDSWTSTPVMDDIFGINGETPRDSLGWLNLIRPDQREDMQAYLNDVLHGKQSFDKAYPIIRPKDNTERWLHGLGEVEFDEQGAALRLVGTIQDVTESRRNNLILHGRLELSKLAQQGRIEELLRASLDKSEALTGSQIGFFHFVNQDQENLTLQTWSTHTLEHMCKAEGEGMHYPVSQAGVWAECLKTLAPVIHNDYASLPNRKGMPQGHAEVKRELTVPVIRQGRAVAIAGVGNKATDYTEADASIVQELTGFVMDLVSNIEAERSLRQSEAKLRKTTDNLQAAVENLTLLNTELERFAFIASHDLQEPLRNITTYTQLIDRKYRDKIGPEGKEYFELVVGGAKRMYALINDLLTYSRTADFTHPAHLVSSAQSCKAAIENLYSAIKECNATINVGELPSVIGDEVQVMQLFQNLIANAVKFRHPERRTIITIDAVRLDEFWEFIVSDNGIGFNPNEQDVFELFRRVHAIRGYSGTGVGLAICKRIVLRNGGRIWAESAPGKGSVFHFTLPAPEDESEQEAAAATTN